MNISESVNYILKSYENKYKNLEEAKIEIDICGYKYCYDAMSLGQYYSCLPSQLRNDLYSELKLKLKLSNEQEKERKERYAIMMLSLFKDHLKQFTINKLTRPDFILENGQTKIGIEVTELCIESVKVIGKIAEEFFNKKTPVEQLRDNAIRKHGKKAERFIYSSVLDHNYVGTNTYDVFEFKKKFAENIIKKFKKYEKEAIEYNEMIILCVHNENIITDDKDAKEVLNLISYFPENKITTVIIYINENNEISMYEEEFCKK